MEPQERELRRLGLLREDETYNEWVHRNDTRIARHDLRATEEEAAYAWWLAWVFAAVLVAMLAIFLALKLWGIL